MASTSNQARWVEFLHPSQYPDLVGTGTESALQGKLYNGTLINTVVRITSTAGSTPSGRGKPLLVADGDAGLANLHRLLNVQDEVEPPRMAAPKNKPYYRQFAKSRY